MRTKRSAWSALALLAASSVSCYDPAVRERVVLTIAEQGPPSVVIETFFKQGEDLTRQEQREIQEVLDLYDQGRDPWLRGLQRSGSAAIAHSRQGAGPRPESIRREAVLP